MHVNYKAKEAGPTRSRVLGMADNRTLDKTAVVLLSLFVFSIFFSQSGISLFGPLSLLALFALRIKKGPSLQVPQFLVLAGLFFILASATGLFVSENISYAMGKLWGNYYLVLGWLLLCAPLETRHWKRVGHVFFISAILASLYGIAESILLYPFRVDGFTNPVHFAGLLSVGALASFASLISKDSPFTQSRAEKVLVAIALLATLSGTMLTMTRAVWVSVALSITVVLVIHDWKRAAKIIIALAIVIAVFAGTTDTIVENRVRSIGTHFTKFINGTGTFGARTDLWRGAYLMFREHPYTGVGAGDFTEELDRLIADGRVPEIDKYSKVQAHNIYMQWLATQGIPGIISLLVLLISLIVFAIMLLRKGWQLGGYAILLGVLNTSIWGMMESNLSISKYLAALFFLMGFFGGMRPVSSGPPQSKPH